MTERIVEVEGNPHGLGPAGVAEEPCCGLSVRPADREPFELSFLRTREDCVVLADALSAGDTLKW